MTSTELLIIGIGNPLMGDDGIGVAVAETLAAGKLPVGVRVVEAGTIGLALLDLWQGYERVWLVDAVRMGLAAGQWRWLEEADLEGLEADGFDAHCGLAGTLALAMELGQLPQKFRLLGVEPEQVGPGLSLSPCGRKAVASLLSELHDRMSDEA